MEKIIIGLILILASSNGLTQQAHLYSGNAGRGQVESIQEKQLEYLDSLYVYQTGADDALINGRDYIRYFFNSSDNPLLRFNEGRSASVIFNGRRFNGLVLNYDTYTDQVIYSDNNLILNNKVCEVALNSDNVSRFELYFKYDTLIFRHFRNEYDSTFNLDDGFFEVVHDGVCKYIIKHVSRLYISDGQDKYPYSPEGYVMVTDRFVQTGSKRQFIKLFGDRSDEIRQYIHKNRIRFRRAEKNQISDILKFYESLQPRIG